MTDRDALEEAEDIVLFDDSMAEEGANIPFVHDGGKP